MKKQKKVVFKKLNIFLLSIVALVTNAYLLYNVFLLNGIENTGRYLGMGLLLALDVLIFTEMINFLKKKQKFTGYTIFMLFLIVYIVVNVFGSLIINKVYSSIDEVSKNFSTYSTSLVVLSDSTVTLENINTKKVGIIDDVTSIEGYVISNEIITENNLNLDLQTYSSFATLLSALYDKEVEAIFITSNYISMFTSIEKFINISSETKTIVTKTKELEKEEIISNKDINDPFSILLIGVDSESEGINSSTANGDSLILLTINPNTSNITMVSIPRDSYVPITCFEDKIENKITHSSWYGASCTIDTIEAYFDIPVDYYVMINFKGVVKLVNALGGVTVDVPQYLCTGDSDRSSTAVCINKGLQTLNGEQALVLARNRNSLTNGDLDREQNQQLLINSIIEKLKTVNSVDQVSKVLEAIANNVDTNFTTNQILSFYDLAKEILITNNNEVNIDSLLLQGNGQMIYDENMQLVLWDYILNKDSVNAVVSSMKNNLGITNNYSTSFNYSPNNTYLKPIIGSEFTSNTFYSVLPNFTSYTQVSAKNWLTNNGFSVSFVSKESSSSNGTIIGQSIPANKRLDKISNKSIILYISKYVADNSQ